MIRNCQITEGVISWIRSGGVHLQEPLASLRIAITYCRHSSIADFPAHRLATLTGTIRRTFRTYAAPKEFGSV